MKNKIIQPLSAGFCATVLAIAGSVTANVAASAVLPSKAFALASTSNGSETDSSLPPVRETLTKEEAEALPGCEAYFDSAKHEFVIRPKNGASEGVISYSLDNKKDDFEAIRKKLIFDGDSDEVSVRFDKRVYIYDSTDATSNDTLFYQINVKTINITDNLNIKFAKNLAKFFMQDYRKSADHLNYIKGVENWDTSHVESMEKMFNLASQLEGKLDLSKWDVSNTDKLNLMFSGVGNENDSFVLDFSNKKFKNSADVTNMFNSFRGVLIANNWTVADPNGTSNPIQNLMNSTSSILTHWNGSAYTGPSWHLLITDNPTILDKNKTAKYKFYKKVKVIYKANGIEKSVELELPAVYDSRIDADGKPDTSKPASSDPMKVIKPQIKEAIQNAITQLRTENPSLNLPQNVIPVPVKEILDSDSPAALFQDYYLGLVKEETVKAKTTYKADTNLEYKKVEYDTQPQDGKKQVITGAMKDGAWDPDATSEKEITKVVNGVARVGNQTTTVTVLEPGITYVADGNLAYNTTETQSEGVKGTSTSIDTYEVNSETGLTNTLDHHDMRIKKATNKVVKVGNKQVTTETIEPGATYEADSSLDYQAQSETAGESGTKSVTKVYKVDPTSGLTAELDGTPTEAITNAAKNKVIKVGNKQVTTETIEPGATYQADSSLEYNKTSETAGEAGTKSVTKVYKVNKDTGLTTELDGTPTETTTKAAKNKVIKVGNKQVTTETIEPGTTYEADSSLDYQAQSETAGEAGTKSVTKVYKVNKDTGLTTELDGTPTEAITKAAKNKVIKVGNVKTENKVIKFTTEEISDPTLPEGQTQTTEGKDGSEKLVTTYEVNSNTGLTDKVLKTETKDHVDAVKKVVRHGTKKNTPEPPAPDPHDSNNPSGQGGQGSGTGNTGDGGQGSQGSEGGQGGGTGNTGSGVGDGTHGGLNPDNPYGGHFVDPAWTYNPELNIWEWNGDGTNDHSNNVNGSNSNSANGSANGSNVNANANANGSNANGANGSNGDNASGNANGANSANGAGSNGANASNSSNAKNHKLSATGANASGAAFASFGSMLLGLLGLFGAASKRRSSKHSNY